MIPKNLKNADVGIPQTPTPPLAGKRRQWGHPSHIKNADILNGWSPLVLSEHTFNLCRFTVYCHLIMKHE